MSWLPSMKGASWAAVVLALITLTAVFIMGTCVGGCAKAPPAIDDQIARNNERIARNAAEIARLEQGLAAGTPIPAGSIPPLLPAELGIGLGDVEAGATWMKAQPVRWWGRYRYLVTDATGGWATNWCSTCARDGRFAARYLNDSAAAGIMPVFTWYNLLGEPGGGEDATYAKVKSPAAMKTYFSDFRLLMQVCKAFGKPVLIHLEPDGYAQLQIQTAGNVNAPAAVAATGLPELVGVSDTVSGWGWAFARIRDRVGATNVMLAPHYSTWSTGVDLMRGSGLSADIATHVGRTVAFLSGLGLASQDLVATEWLDRDAQTRGIWWDTGGDAGTNTASFNRDLAIFEALNRATGKRLLLWQVPHGTSWSSIHSNHAEYVFGQESAAHRERLGSVGLVGVLFGAGASSQTNHLNGWGADGGLYLRGQVADFQRSVPPVCVPPPPPPPICTGGRDGGLELPR